MLYGIGFNRPGVTIGFKRAVFHPNTPRFSPEEALHHIKQDGRESVAEMRARLAKLEGDLRQEKYRVATDKDCTGNLLFPGAIDPETLH